MSKKDSDLIQSTGIPFDPKAANWNNDDALAGTRRLGWDG